MRPESLLVVPAALVVGGLLLLAVGVDPLAYYAAVLRRALLSPNGLQETLTRTAPLFLIGASLMVSFRAGLWNLGVDGQFLLGAVLTAAAAPWAAAALPLPLAWALCLGIGAATAALWALPPALLRGLAGVNEIITTLMMNFLGVLLANLLIRYAFADPQTTVPITRTLPVAERLPRLFGSTVGLGVPFAALVLLATHLMLSRSAAGLRLRMVGESPRAAAHAGLKVTALVVATLLGSGALAGLAGSVVVLGTLGNVRAEWNPGYGLAVVPLVLLARLDGRALLGFGFLFAALSIGAEGAAIRLGVPAYFTLALVGLVLLFLGASEAVAGRRGR